jgi:hypothetical protein
MQGRAGLVGFLAAAAALLQVSLEVWVRINWSGGAKIGDGAGARKINHQWRHGRGHEVTVDSLV